MEPRAAARARRIHDREHPHGRRQRREQGEGLGVLIGIMVAIVLLGPGPGAVLGATTMVVSVAAHARRGSLRAQQPRRSSRGSRSLAGLFFHATVRLAGLGSDDAAYYLVVFLTFVVALVAQLRRRLRLSCATSTDRRSCRRLRTSLMPVMSAQLFSALLTMAAAYVAVEAGTVGIVLVVLVLLIFQYLIGELLKSKQRGEKLHRIATTDELTGLANRERFRARLDERIAAATRHRGDVRRDAARPRPLQGDQRHARPPLRRRAAARSRPAAGGGHRRRRPRRAPRRRRVRGSAGRGHRRRG